MLVVNCQFGVTANAIGIRDDAGVENIQLSNNLFVLGTNAQSVRLNPGNLFAITGNGSISPSGGTTHFNIVSNASGRGGSISGNNIYGGGNIGILLGSGTNGNVIGINNISSGGTPISDSGSGNQYVGNPGSDSKLGNINLTGAVVVEGGAVATSKSYLQINAAGIALPNGAEINW
jgi:hypothetical protein